MNKTASTPRYCPTRTLPPYSYVPGLAPHPMSDPRGHSFGRHEPSPVPLDETNWHKNAAYLWAIDLFNHGFYWEAHEAWESLWHAAGRTGPTADFLKGLIKLAAAGVKLREGRPAGVRQHAARAAELLTAAANGLGGTKPLLFGLPVGNLIQLARQIAAQAAELCLEGQADASRHLSVTLCLADL